LGLAELLQWNVLLFFLILARWSGMVMLAPVFGARGVPMPVKLGLAAGLSIVLYPLLFASVPDLPTSLLPIIALIVKETMVGLVMGYVISLITAVMQGAGELMDFQMGFVMGNTIDPIYGMQSPLTGNFLMVLATMLLLAMDGHHYIIAAMLKSYQYIPINPSVLFQGMDFYINMTAQIFALSLQVSLPVYGALFLANIGVGLLAKTVPQLNIFSVLFPVKIIFGFIIFYLAIPFFGVTVSQVFETAMEWVFQFLRGWNQ
jgi:flagellar biosynthetic protein FliR